MTRTGVTLPQKSYRKTQYVHQHFVFDVFLQKCHFFLFHFLFIISVRQQLAQLRSQLESPEPGTSCGRASTSSFSIENSSFSAMDNHTKRESSNTLDTSMAGEKIINSTLNSDLGSLPPPPLPSRQTEIDIGNQKDTDSLDVKG